VKGNPTRTSGCARRARGRVLLLDDDPFMRALLRDALMARGLQVTQFGNAREAIAAVLVTDWPPDVIVADLVMPDMDGRTFLALVRSSSKAHIPVLILSAVARGMERELEGEGAEVVLDKSWGADTIAEFVGMVAAERQARTEAARRAAAQAPPAWLQAEAPEPRQSGTEPRPKKKAVWGS
jgi:two-component system chemotaxis response regulator CheY